MRIRNRFALALATVSVVVLAVVPSALANTYNGEGIYGSTDDQQLTTAMFIVIALIPTMIVVFSLIQAWLDHRKHARLDAAKHRASAAEWKGGW